MTKLKNTNFSGIDCKTPGCTTKIKRRLRELKTPHEYCYKCHCDQEAQKGHFMGKHGKTIKENSRLSFSAFLSLI